MAIDLTIPGVDSQVVLAATEMNEAQKAQPEWLWHQVTGHEHHTSYGRWPAKAGASPYVRLDIMLAEIQRVRRESD